MTCLDFKANYSVCNVPIIQNFSKMFFVFFRFDWIELVELSKKNYVLNLKQVFYECQNFGSISLNMENNDTLNFFHKTLFENLKYGFSYTTRGALSNQTEKNEKHFAKILKYGHITHIIICLKIRISHFRQVNGR